MVQILLADDHAVVRAGLKTIIESAVIHAVVDEAMDGDTTYEKIRKNNYDVVILDVNMPNTDSFALVANVLTMKPQTKILMCSMNAEEVYAKKYLQAGAKGYINKNSSKEEIGNAIQTVLRGERYISAALTQHLTERALGKQADNPFDLLSPRELEIAQHLIRGESVAEISNSLHLHTSTVGTHKAKVFEKLQCKNVIELTELARLHQLVSN